MLSYATGKENGSVCSLVGDRFSGLSFLSKQEAWWGSFLKSASLFAKGVEEGQDGARSFSSLAFCLKNCEDCGKNRAPNC